MIIFREYRAIKYIVRMVNQLRGCKWALYFSSVFLKGSQIKERIIIIYSYFLNVDKTD